MMKNIIFILFLIAGLFNANFVFAADCVVDNGRYDSKYSGVSEFKLKNRCAKGATINYKCTSGKKGKTYVVSCSNGGTGSIQCKYGDGVEWEARVNWRGKPERYCGS